MSKRLGTANTITIIRIVLIPVFVVALLAPWPEWFFDLSPENFGDMSDFAALYKPWIAAVIYAVLALTDSLDGYIARKKDEVTTFGKFIDPLADKLLVTAALLALVELGDLPSWVALIIISREFIVSGIRMIASSKGVVIAANMLGKVKTVITIVAILLFIVKKSSIITNLPTDYYLAFYAISWLVMIIALLITIISLLSYIKSHSHLLKD